MSGAKKTALYALLLAMALVCSYIEAVLPFPQMVAGVKLGLANVVVLLALYTLSARAALLLAVARILLAGFLFGSLSSVLYSLAGGLLSFAVMWALSKVPAFGPLGVSVAGGVAHNIGQLAVAAFALHTAQIWYYLPVLLASGTVAGALVGVLGGVLIGRLRPMLKRFDNKSK